MTNEEMKKEIERLKNSPNVKKAQNSEQEKLRRQLYKLRWLEKKGRAMSENKAVN